MFRCGSPYTVLTAIVVLMCAVCAPAFASSTPKANKLPLWKVTSAQRTLYVTGAMGIPLDVRPVPERTKEAFEKSTLLVMEGDVGPKAKAKFKALMKQYEPLAEGRVLADELTDIQLQHTKILLGAFGINYTDVQHDQPWAVLMHIAHASEKKSGHTPHPRYRNFKLMAKQRHMAISYLDTQKQEIKIMANLSNELQVAMLMQAVNSVMHPKSAVQNKRGTRKAWTAGNMQSSAKHFDVSFKGYPGLYQAIVTSRHARWTKSLAAMLSKSGQPVFVVVGAPHLFGAHNLLDHLRKDGYTVTQL